MDDPEADYESLFNDAVHELEFALMADGLSLNSNVNDAESADTQLGMYIPEEIDFVQLYHSAPDPGAELHRQFTTPDLASDRHDAHTNRRLTKCYAEFFERLRTVTWLLPSVQHFATFHKLQPTGAIAPAEPWSDTNTYPRFFPQEEAPTKTSGKGKTRHPRL
ncbi:hypothetical protein NW759_009222 [Fusarium solani]|nr:hypothetical protein NW759_009222 [Fusarium solani]